MIYATIISIVYFTQLTTVLYKSVDEIILQAFSFTSAGSWLFNLDLLGYGLLSISTFFIGLTLQTKDKIDSALKLLLMLHGIFFCLYVCSYFAVTRDKSRYRRNNSNDLLVLILFIDLYIINSTFQKIKR